MSRVLYVAMALRKWENLGLTSPIGLPLALKAPKDCPGALLVFDSEEALREVYPDAQIAHLSIEEEA